MAERVVKKLREAASYPDHFFERLRGRSDYKLRVGDYRIIADLDKEEEEIVVTKIGHRRNIYKH